MTQTVTDALQDAIFHTDNDTYRLVRLPARAITPAAGVLAEVGEPFCALIVDKDEVTLLLPDEAASDFAGRLPEHELGETYRLITIDAALSPDLIGFMAVISSALAEANVGVFPYAAFTRDHIMVPAAQFDAALAALESLKEKYASHTGDT